MCRDTRPLAMRRCTTAHLHRLLVVVLVLVVLIVAIVVVGRVADRNRVVVIVVVPGTKPRAASEDFGDERSAMRCKHAHCGGMRSFCPG